MTWKSFELTGRRGNNAFSYDLRGEDPKIFVPPLKSGPLDLLELGDRIVFSDMDEYDVLRDCTGLAFELETEVLGRPAVVVDNHNFVFYFWAKAMQAGIFEPGLTLLHVDQHKDSRVPAAPYEGQSLEDAFAYTHEVLQVGDYIRPALDLGWFSRVVNVTGEAGLDQTVEGDLILNVDLDFFAPELSYISFEKARDFIREHAKRAKFISFASSPFFIDQALAIQKLRALF